MVLNLWPASAGYQGGKMGLIEEAKQIRVLVHDMRGLNLIAKAAQAEIVLGRMARLLIDLAKKSEAENGKTRMHRADGMPGMRLSRRRGKAAKNRWCPECNVQYFARCETTSGRLLDKIGKGKAHEPITEKGNSGPVRDRKIPEHKAKPQETKPAKPLPVVKPGMAGALQLLGIK